jgi:hypothetical protein
MGGTDAERQRRHRAHKRGDHSLCSPQRCRPEAVTAPVTPVTPSGQGLPPAPRLRARGRWLWRELVENGNPGPAERVLIAEACRLADRLDRLDAISNGKDRAWLQIADDLSALADSDGRVEIVVDKVLGEARQQQTTLKQILGELRQASSGAAPAAQPGGSFLDQLAARRKARLADAAGS